MSEYYLTTRKGFIDRIKLYRYDFAERILSDNIKKDKLKNWLAKRSDFLIYSFEDTCFFSFTELPTNSSSQYHLSISKTIEPPFENTQQISSFISSQINKELLQHYRQFLNKNIFVVEAINLFPFSLLKSIEYNTEVFESGNYFIHISPTTKIISSQDPIDSKYVSYLKTYTQNHSESNDLHFNIINRLNFYRYKINLLDDQANINQILLSNINSIASFDYHFIASYSPEIFGTIVENTLKDLKKTIYFLDPVINNFKLPNFFGLTSEKYFKIDILELENSKNLLVGCPSEFITIHSKSQTQYGLRVEYSREITNSDEIIVVFLKDEKIINEISSITLPKRVKANVFKKENWIKPYITKVFSSEEEIYFETNKQSASYFNGIYKSVNNWNILPIVCDNLNIQNFNDLVYKFNRNGENVIILPTLNIDDNDKFESNIIHDIVKNEKNKTKIILFCQYKLMDDFLSKFKNLHIEIYKGEIDNVQQNLIKLSNFVCKCLEKMGGVVSAISNTHVDASGYFIGIDLGHTTVGDSKFSNLAMALFDNRGILKKHVLMQKIPRNENLLEFYCEKSFKKLLKFFNEEKIPNPTKFIIHRDGRLHSEDINTLINSINNIFGDIEVDIVEIIKSGFPVFIKKTEPNNVVNPLSGNSYQDNKHKYAILITNDQANEYSTVLSPIIIKHKYGKTEFNKIVEQVYWFTKIYSNNLYFSTRLPATTQIANDLAKTLKTRIREIKSI